ncbi:MAG: ABC transporter substrate-binding protein [Patescibacteria group bacterium]|nr:ABC transporter substrate-binding protein [Patescibacteria group bacterium]
MSKQKLFTKIAILILIVAGIYIYSSRSYKPSSTDPVVIALPTLGFPPRNLLVEGFKQGMEELGYREGIEVIYRDHELIRPNPAGLEEARNLIKSYIDENVDLIFVSTNTGAKIALEETEAANKAIPIIALDLLDPVESGLVQSYKSSGNNLIGIAEERIDSIGKLLNTLVRIAPEAQTLGVLTDGFIIPSDVAPAKEFLRVLKEQVGVFGLELIEYKTTVPPGPELEGELARVLDGIQEKEVDAWIHIPGHFIPTQQVLANEMTQRANIPFALPAAIEINPETGELAGLFSYGAGFRKKGRQGAVLADKIFRGSQPSEIPVEFPEKYDLVINLKIAEEIGFIIPQEILEITDRVIK